MNRDDIIRMAREAGPLISTPFDVWCERFAALVAAQEREACARLCDEWSKREDDVGGYIGRAIRARGKV